MQDQDQVRVYEFSYADGRKAVCIADFLNVVIFPETGRENRLVEYGRHGEVQDEYDYHVQPSFLELGDRALMRPIKDVDAYDFFPELDHVPTVSRRYLVPKEEYEATLESYREQVYASRSARKHIEHAAELAVEDFRKQVMRDKQKQLAELPPPPSFEDLLQSHLKES